MLFAQFNVHLSDQLLWDVNNQRMTEVLRDLAEIKR